MSEKDATEGENLIGISLSSEAHAHDASRDVLLGAVTIVTQAVSIASLREAVFSQLSHFQTSFTFLTKEGWPISKAQENTVRVSQLVTNTGLVRIQHCYDKLRVGVKTSEGKALGFVFIDYNLSCPVSLFRQVLHQQLGQLRRVSEDHRYQFIDRNGWPVSRHQEMCVSVIDIITEGCIYLLEVHPESLPPSRLASLTSTDHMMTSMKSIGSSFTSSLHGSPMADVCLAKRRRYRDQLGRRTNSSDTNGRSSSDTTRHSKRLAARTLTYGHDKDKDVNRPEEPEPKQILISYVRAEAAQHAVVLKEELMLLGYSVFLDVHEIKSGADWQDELNFAVRSCEIFVPLVTARYGETRWTNREVKLADVISKFIVPVCFLDHWPPKCLAIQFATNQYIPWKSPDTIKQELESSNPSRATDIRLWERQHVKVVAIQIGSLVQLHEQQKQTCPTAQLSQRVSVLKSCPVALPDGMAQLAAQDREGTPLVVICIHPQQKTFGITLTSILEHEGYEVWCSCDLAMTSSSGDLDIDRVASPELIQSQEGSSFSLLSQISQDSYELNPAEQESRLQFQRKADEAGVVIVVLSKAFADSKTCKQQVFYCEHRKRVIPLRYEEFCMPGWMGMLIGTGVFEDARADSFQESLLARVKRCLDPTARPGSGEDVSEAKIDYHAQILRKKIPKGVSVYIAGGTQFFHKDSEKICRSIGKQLARLENIQIVTGGFFGVGEAVGRSYQEECDALSKTSTVWHVLPERDDQDRSCKAKQNKDHTFPIVSYGRTVYSGDSVREREVIVSRVFDICVLVEGGSGAAHEAEQFSWSDHVVIPVRVTGGAACGKFNVPDKIFEIPPSVTEKDWSILDNKKATAEMIGEAVARIVCTLKERFKLDSPTYTYTTNPLGAVATSLTPPLLTSSAPPPSSTILSPHRRRPSLTKMKTVLLGSQASFSLPQGSGEPDGETSDASHESPVSTSDTQGSRKRCSSQP